MLVTTTVKISGERCDEIRSEDYGALRANVKEFKEDDFELVSMVVFDGSTKVVIADNNQMELPL